MPGSKATYFQCHQGDYSSHLAFESICLGREGDFYPTLPANGRKVLTSATRSYVNKGRLSGSVSAEANGRKEGDSCRYDCRPFRIDEALLIADGWSLLSTVQFALDEVKTMLPMWRRLGREAAVAEFLMRTEAPSLMSSAGWPLGPQP